MIEAMFAALLGAASVTHPVYPPQYSLEQADALRQEVADALAMSPRDLYDAVPVGSGIYFCGCPHCDGGAQEHAMAWELGLGDRVRCRYCGMMFPNEEYPNNRETVLTAPSGARHVYRWHENEAGRQYFFEAHAWYSRWGWTRDRALRLANLYALTGDPEYGDRAAALVGRYAQVYPDYAIRFDYPFRPVRFWPADQKWPYDDDIGPFRGAKFYWWAYGDIPVKLARAYDLLAAGDSFERLRGVLGEDIEERIERDLIRLGYEFASAHPDSHGNMSPGLYADMVVAGRIIGAPDMVHEAVARFQALLHEQFFVDGWWRECAPSYHWQTIGNLAEVAKVAAGYSDPPGCPEPRFDHLDLMADAPLLDRAFRVGDEGCLPDGRLMPVNDTWWFGKRRPLERSVCRFWPAMGHAILGAGTGDTQFQAHVNWNASYGHTHMDSGAILVFAHGKELLSDIGYTHTRYRNWTLNSASHNMVVVDARSQQLEGNASNQTGNILFFDDTYPHVRAIDLDVQPAYPGCSVYRRRLVHVHVDEGRDYLVDRFDVEGGGMHDYFLHGSADEEGTLETSVPFPREVATLVPEWGGTEEHTGEDCLDFSGERFHPYGFLWNVRAADAGGAWTATWQYGDVGLKSFLFPESDTILYRIQSPAIRQARDDDTKLHDYLRNGVMQRHTGGRSAFVAVHVPFRSSPWIEQASVDGGAIRVAYGGVTDTIRWEGDRLTVASSAGWQYDSGVAVTGGVIALDRDDGFALRVDGAVPDARLIRLDFGGMRSVVFRVKAVEEGRIVLENDPGFVYDSGDTEARFVYHPHEALAGPVTWAAWEPARSD
ncbi:MAG: heparinase II/III family protein [Candidatus Hydrogenedentes bacterium]|nr:heparinase II/III family protein [Candidatus Hydrogenedentota bacterium]